MSNTTVVAPVAVAAGGVGIAAALVGGCIVGLVAAASWVCQETEEDRKAVAEYHQSRRKELLENPQPHIAKFDMIHEAWPQLKAESLYMKNPDTLVQSAQGIGYRLEPLADTKRPLKEQPYIFLRKPTGERLAISFNQDRQIVLTTAGDDLRLRHLVRQHTVDRALDHLQKKGMTIQTAKLANGELQILAKEQTNKHGDGLAELKAQVRNDGTAWIDVDRLQGNRCQEIVQEFAEAVGGKVIDTKMKVASFQLPGESAKTNIKV